VVVVIVSAVTQSTNEFLLLERVVDLSFEVALGYQQSQARTAFKLTEHIVTGERRWQLNV
jgi:hypothetical protein